ncbi:type II secretion system major pseudopilin GspG [Desulfocapsa sp. AH-315-G09]|uniref:Type II secretion system core protein G n=1 Tax=Desulfotalea psychrophila TaxID=84980 RepID=A0ABS3AVX4_9BACT|nr:type II secretion system major pseudopilin GspG [Desulfocapsa sp.]MBN4065419.1 type II secretion system major pseudopilin GspG [Desulfocapsa sp. AH-315-G09]MBN4068941.1 type II secretion system major pseudopilin GspG [Desulfotalea psychrophila]
MSKKQTKTENITSNNKGFSLIELLIVMIIMGLLASLVGPRLFGKLGMAKEKTARSQIAMLMTSLGTYRLDIGSFPSEDEGLTVLMKNKSNHKKWDGPYLAKDLPIDPWGSAYIYKNPGTHGEIDIISLGLDGKEGGEGEKEDIGSWN